MGSTLGYLEPQGRPLAQRPHTLGLSGFNDLEWHGFASLKPHPQGLSDVASKDLLVTIVVPVGWSLERLLLHIPCWDFNRIWYINYGW